MGEATPLFGRIDAEKLLAEIEAENAAKAAKEEEKKPAFEEMPPIAIDDFAKVDLRVAKVVDCKPVKKAKKLLELTLDDGTGTPRTVASGIALYYKPEELIGHNVIVVANLKPATLCGVESRGMILAGGEDDVKVVFVDYLEPGTKIR
jgi:methionyl-tRNA synthetase